jgi:hypothetical protein
MNKKRNNHRQYERKQGSREAIGERKRTISFSWEKLSPDQGQTVEQWEELGHLAIFCRKLQQIGQYNAGEALAQKFIKQYTKIGFPDNSKFKKPTHISPTAWGVIHIKTNSKEVVAGYVEDDVFYIVFLDADHHFWPTDIQSRGKNFK